MTRPSFTGFDPAAHDAAGAILEAVVSTERAIAQLQAFRARAVEALREVEGVDLLPTSTERELPLRSLRAELAAALRITENAAMRLLQDSQTLVADLPETLEALSEGRIGYRAAQLVSEQARSLPEESRAAFDGAGRRLAGLLNPARLQTKLAALRERLHQQSAEERHLAAAEERQVRISPAQDGMAWLTAYLPAAEAYAAYARITSIAEQIVATGENAGQTVDQLRADLLVGLISDLAPEEGAAGTGMDVGRFRGVRPTVVVTVPVETLLGGDQPAELEGYGPIDPQTARELTANAPGLYRLLVDAHTGVRLDLGRRRYQVPADLRLWLRLRDEHCRFPGCGRSPAGCDLDHTVAWQYGGESRADNLAHLCPGHHTMKHHGGWSVRQDADGTLQWRSPLGRDYATRPAGAG